MAEEYDISKTLKYVKYLYPILLDAHGNIIDGDHRSKIDPNWPTITLEHIKTPTQLTSARLIANNHRRTMPKEEKEELINKLARCLLEDDKVPRYEILKAISDITAIPYRTVSRYISEAYKRSGGYETEKPNGHVAIQEEQAEIAEPEKVVLPSAEEYLADYRARHTQPDVEYLSWSLTKNYGVPEREARAMARGRPAYTGQAAKAPAKPSRYEPPQSPTCRCPMCMRDGADKLAILANFVENTVLAQRTLSEFVTEALK